jgi:hypothetical protein
MICRPRKARGVGPIGSRSAGVSRRSSDHARLKGSKLAPSRSRGPLILVIAVLSFDHNTLVDKGETGSVKGCRQISRFPDIRPARRTEQRVRTGDDELLSKFT